MVLYGIQKLINAVFLQCICSSTKGFFLMRDNQAVIKALIVQHSSITACSGPGTGEESLSLRASLSGRGGRTKPPSLWKHCGMGLGTQTRLH